MGQELAEIKDNIPEKIRSGVAGQLSEGSRLLYIRDMEHFEKWMQNNHLNILILTRDDMVAYRVHLDDTYANSTASRMLTVARRVLNEARLRGMIETNPANEVRGFTTEDESPRTALTELQCRQMLESIDQSTPKGKRDYALLSLLIKTGIRRAEVVELKVKDQGMDGGHYILTIRHGKGDKRRTVKLQPSLHRAIQEYLVTRGDIDPDDYMFVGILKNGKWKNTPIHMYGGLTYILLEHAKSIGLELTPHDLRATFATLALEGKAPLQKVQYAMGHKDPRTTERYHLKKGNLDDNATDYIHLD
jgi:site-specific recombinase XerD